MRKEILKRSHPRSASLLCHPQSAATQGILSRRDEMLSVGHKPSEHDGWCDKMPGVRAKALSGMTMERGRSMVEMLGVLAVIGALSVAGIMGFRSALDKHYATQTINRLKLRAMSVSSQLLLGSTASLSEFNETDGAYQISNTPDVSESDVFLLTVNDVPKAVCEQIVKMDWNITKINPSDCSETTLTFLFRNDLGDCSDCVNAGVQCNLYGKECGTCSSTKGFTPHDADCANNNNGSHCVRGYCSSCAENYYWANNACSPCTKEGVHTTIESNRHNCLGSMYYYVTDKKWLIGCNYNYVYKDTVDEESCKACSNRCYLATDKSCRLAGSDQTYRRMSDEDGTCTLN